RRNIDFNQYSILFRPVRPYRPSLFPYTTLFRSRCQSNEALDRAVRAADWTVSVPINVHERGTAISGGARPPPRTVAGTKPRRRGDRKSTRLNSSHVKISYAVFCLKKKNGITKRL